MMSNYGYKKKSVPVIFEPPCTFVMCGAEFFQESRNCLQRLDARMEEKGEFLAEGLQDDSSGRPSSRVLDNDQLGTHLLYFTIRLL